MSYFELSRKNDNNVVQSAKGLDHIPGVHLIISDFVDLWKFHWYLQLTLSLISLFCSSHCLWLYLVNLSLILSNLLFFSFLFLFFFFLHVFMLILCIQISSICKKGIRNSPTFSYHSLSFIFLLIYLSP